MDINIKDGYKVTEVGVIPDDWDVKKVGDICDFIVPGRNKPKKFEGDIPWITTPDLKDSRSVSQSRLGLCISIDEAKNVGSKIVPSGSVLMSCAGELGIVAFTEKEIVINQQLHAFIPSSIIDGWFLLNVIKSQKKYIDSVATKTAVPYINKDNCNSIPIPLPPLSEQKAIAHALSDVDNLITAIDQLITKKRNLKQGTMQELLTGKKRLPGFSGKWEVKTFEEVLRVIDGDRGDNYPSNDELLNNGYCLFLSAKNVTKEGFKFSECIFITKEKDDLLGKGKLVKKDLVLTTRGTVGNIAFFDDSVPFENIRINSGMVIIRNEDKNLDNIYLYSFLKSNFFQYQVDRVVFGSAQPQLTVKVISKFEIPFPLLPEQKAIAEILSDIDKEIEALEKNRDKYKAIKQGMMQELLTGKTRLKINVEDRENDRK